MTGTATVPAASGEGRPAASGNRPFRSHPIAVVRRHVPAPIPGLMDLPAVVRRPFPVPRVGQMEFI